MEIILLVRKFYPVSVGLPCARPSYNIGLLITNVVTITLITIRADKNLGFLKRFKFCLGF